VDQPAEQFSGPATAKQTLGADGEGPEKAEVGGCEIPEERAISGSCIGWVVVPPGVGLGHKQQVSA